jgi:cell division protein FtsQ
MPEAARRRRVIALAIAVSILLICLGWGLTYTSLFAARHIRIDGNHVLSDREVRSIAGVTPSTNVAHLDETGVVTRLEANPWVAGATVHADWPSTLVVSIQERQPVGVIAALGTTSILASDGTSLPLKGVRATGLPTVRAALGEPTPDQLGAAASLLHALDPVVFDQVDQVVVGGDGTVTLTLSSGALVDAGERGQERDKALALRTVLQWAAQKNLTPTSIDVSTPAAVSIKLSDGSTATM